MRALINWINYHSPFFREQQTTHRGGRGFKIVALFHRLRRTQDNAFGGGGCQRIATGPEQSNPQPGGGTWRNAARPGASGGGTYALWRRAVSLCQDDRCRNAARGV